MSWIAINIQQNLNARLRKFIVHTVYNHRVGKNLALNRQAILKNKIDLLNLTWDTFKFHCSVGGT